MAVPNMIVTLAMNATKYASGLRKAAGDTSKFGQFTTKAFNLAKGAMVGLTLSVISFIPQLLKMGAESRKADIQLRFMLENMEGMSKATTQTTKRLSAYASQVSRATGIDDEAIKSVQKKLLIFDSLRKTTDEMGGSFDRATSAAIDLAAGGFGDMESNAVKLGRMLENPLRNLGAMNRAGIMFTDIEQKKIEKLVRSGDQFKAQELILQKVEDRVKGLAEESATPFDKMLTILEDIGEIIGEAMLEPLEDVNKELNEWLASPQAKKDVQDIADAFKDGAKGVRDMARFLKEVKGFLDGITSFNMDWVQILADFQNSVVAEVRGGPKSTDSNLDRGPGRIGVKPGSAPVVINFNTPVDSVSAGREIDRVLSDYKRANGGR